MAPPSTVSIELIRNVLDDWYMNKLTPEIICEKYEITNDWFSVIRGFFKTYLEENANIYGKDAKTAKMFKKEHVRNAFFESINLKFPRVDRSKKRKRDEDGGDDGDGESSEESLEKKPQKKQKKSVKRNNNKKKKSSKGEIDDDGNSDEFDSDFEGMSDDESYVFSQDGDDDIAENDEGLSEEELQEINDDYMTFTTRTRIYSISAKSFRNGEKSYVVCEGENDQNVLMLFSFIRKAYPKFLPFKDDLERRRAYFTRGDDDDDSIADEEWDNFDFHDVVIRRTTLDQVKKENVDVATGMTGVLEDEDHGKVALIDQRDYIFGPLFEELKVYCSVFTKKHMEIDEMFSSVKQ